MLAFGAGLSACKPELVVGTRTCFADAASEAADAGVRPPGDAAVRVPWATGFEQGFCDYHDAGGYCRVNSDAEHLLVEAPVRDGRFAAAFTVTGNDAGDALQARCVVQGRLPESAYYGAWYYVPSYAENTQNWNLFHFEGWNGTEQHKLWDVSIASSNGKLSLYVYDFLNTGTRPPPNPPELLPGSWVHIVFFLQRAAGATGSFALYQDDALVIARPNIVTDDSERGEWYVGNLADGLTPPESTLYVDDVTISASR